jgi:hypothetical protein
MVVITLNSLGLFSFSISPGSKFRITNQAKQGRERSLSPPLKKKKDGHMPLAYRPSIIDFISAC